MDDILANEGFSIIGMLEEGAVAVASLYGGLCVVIAHRLLLPGNAEVCQRGIASALVFAGDIEHGLPMTH